MQRIQRRVESGFVGLMWCAAVAVAQLAAFGCDGRPIIAGVPHAPPVATQSGQHAQAGMSGPADAGVPAAHDAAPNDAAVSDAAAHMDAQSWAHDAGLPPSRPDASPPHASDATPSDACSSCSDDADLDTGSSDGQAGLPPAEPEQPPRHDDCSWPTSPVKLTNSIVPTAWLLQVADDYVYYTERLQTDCTIVPPACREQTQVRRIPRCGGPAEAVGLPFDGGANLALGGRSLYVWSSRAGLYRLDLDSGSRERLNIEPTCVASVAANASQLVVIDACQSKLLRVMRTGSQFDTLAGPVATSYVAATANTLFFTTSEGIEWLSLSSALHGVLTRDVTAATAAQLQADAHAVSVLFRRSSDGLLSVARFPLDGSARVTWDTGTIMPPLSVADGHAYFTRAMADEVVALVRVPTSGAANVQTVIAPIMAARAIDAYGDRAYYTDQGDVFTAKP